jgi:hypothetical protein
VVKNNQQKVSDNILKICATDCFLSLEKDTKRLFESPLYNNYFLFQPNNCKSSTIRCNDNVFESQLVLLYNKKSLDPFG